MICNIELHDELVDSGEIHCPFCDERLEDCSVKKHILCCDMQDIINNNGIRVCRSCGIVHGYEFSNENIDFYENIFKIRRKSVYYRKYHIEKTINDLSTNHYISVHTQSKILRVFKEIEKIIPQVNGKRKRMININFIMKEILKMMGLKHDHVKVTKSKKNINFI